MEREREEGRQGEKLGKRQGQESAARPWGCVVPKPWQKRKRERCPYTLPGVTEPPRREGRGKHVKKAKDGQQERKTKKLTAHSLAPAGACR